MGSTSGLTVSVRERVESEEPPDLEPLEGGSSSGAVQAWRSVCESTLNAQEGQRVGRWVLSLGFKERSRLDRWIPGDTGRLGGVSWGGGVKREAGTSEVREQAERGRAVK